MRRRRHRGFTFIEVLVALLIVALALTAATVATGLSLRNGTVLRDRTYANWIGQNRIAELRLQEQIPAPGRTTGTVEYGNAEWRWEAVVAETGVENLHRIDVSVSFADSERVLQTVTGFASLPGDRYTVNSSWLETGGWAPRRDSDGVER